MTRVADIRRMARKVGLPKLGEQHVRAGTSADDFFKIAAEHAAASPEERKATKHAAGFRRGEAAAEALLGRKAKREDDDKDKKDADEDERDDDDNEDTGAAIDDEDHVDDDKDGDDEEERDDDEDDGNRSLRTGRGVRTSSTAAYRRGAPAPSAPPKPREPVGGTVRIGSVAIKRGAAAAKKLLKG